MKPTLKEIFYVLSAAVIIFAAMEIIHPGIVLAYINLNWVLMSWLFIGILIVTMKSNKLSNQ